MKIFVALVAIAAFSAFMDPGMDDLDKVKYKNFVKAMRNGSTFQYFTVIKVKDIRSNTIKEVCTKGNFISGAVHMELRLDYDPKQERKALDWALSKKDRYFEFKNNKALDNISFFSYDTSLVRTIQKKYDFEKIIRQIEAKHEFSIRLDDDDKMKAFAHVLYNRGYLTGENNCFGGTLEYIDKEMRD